MGRRGGGDIVSDPTSHPPWCHGSSIELLIGYLGNRWVRRGGESSTAAGRLGRGRADRRLGIA